MSVFQTIVGSAFASHPVRWIESAESARSAFARESAAASAEKAAAVADPDANKPKSASGDVLDISPQLQQVQDADKTDAKIEVEKADAKQTDEKTADGRRQTAEETATGEKPLKSPSGEELTPEEEQQVAELKARDQEVRVHEHAHVAAAGAYVTSGPSYTFQTGPDGKKYAIGGEVGIDTSKISGDPQATIQKMQTVAAAALAPAEPSGQDMKVAAEARQAIAEAQVELTQQADDKAPAAATGKAAEEEAEEGEATAGKSDKNKSEASRLVKSFAAGAASAAHVSAYKAQSLMSPQSPRFTAFA